jgi:hypothetical protein
MVARICKVCARPAEKKRQLCERHRKMCCNCRTRPKTPGSSYCKPCNSQLQREYKKRTDVKACKVCKTPIPRGRGNIMCEACSALCHKCHARPKEVGPTATRHLCTECRKDYANRWAAQKRQDPEYMAKKKYRMEILSAIKQGKRQREACAICGQEPTMIFVKRDGNRQLFAFFLCRAHHDGFSGRHGTKPW